MEKGIDVRLATMEDLPKLKDMYRKLIEHMEGRQLYIWDEIYPCEFLVEDIKLGRLYILYEPDDFVSAFALCDSSDGADCVQWKNNHCTALYMDRFAVNVKYLRTGMGQTALKKATEICKKKGADYLRLFVVDENYPAINLYTKAGFERAEGIYDEVIDADLVLHEFGFEIHTNTDAMDK